MQFVNYSNKRIINLINEEDNEDRLTILKTIDVRWLSNYSAINRLLDIFHSAVETIKLNMSLSSWLKQFMPNLFKNQLYYT
jgi:hypothetical protein